MLSVTALVAYTIGDSAVEQHFSLTWAKSLPWSIDVRFLSQRCAAVHPGAAANGASLSIGRLLILPPYRIPVFAYSVIVTGVHPGSCTGRHCPHGQALHVPGRSDLTFGVFHPDDLELSCKFVGGDDGLVADMLCAVTLVSTVQRRCVHLLGESVLQARQLCYCQCFQSQSTELSFRHSEHKVCSVGWTESISRRGST